MKEKNKIYVMAGGPVKEIPDLTAFDEPDMWVGVDKGISTLLERKIVPDIVFGDFDSVKEEHRQFLATANVPTFGYAREKDDTDLALALDWVLEQPPKTVYIFGSTGGRMDHTLAGIQLLLTEEALASSASVWLVDRQNVMYAVPAGTHTLLPNHDYPYVSFVPMTETVKGITLEGFKYPLNKKDIKLGSTLCISNELISEIGTYSFDSGILLVVRSTD